MKSNPSTAIRTAALSAAVAAALGTGAVQAGEKLLSDEEFAKAQQVYFDRCAGCHGTLRKGATGPSLEPERMKKFGTEALKAIIYNGTPGGMPSWGKDGILSQDETELMAKYIQMEPPQPPERSLKDIRESWKVLVPPEQRPKKPQHNYDVDNMFGVVLRDAGKVAIIDGDSKKIISIVPTGYAVHILRSSASGRYFLAIGRDGKATLIDLYMKKPDVVAEVKPCSDARSIDVSKYKGFEDKLAIVGCYWPPHIAILDGQTLEPKKLVSTRGYTVTDGTYHPEPRVASIVANHFKPEWVVSVKETGQVWLVDYSDLSNLKITMIDSAPFLHDGGFDASGRYFMVAANMANKTVVVDTKTGKLEAIINVGTKPHPGRGANWIDPKYGPVTGSTHIGEDIYTVWGSDPEKHPEHAWKVLYKIKTKGAGSLFTKTHPKSDKVWFDHALNKDAKIQQTVCYFLKKDPMGGIHCQRLADHGRAVHFEYNKAGDEVWVSIWDKKDAPSELVIIDDKTGKVKQRIQDKRLITPTGKWNVHNTVGDIY
ncbi:MAG TPA: nitrite reductase [Chromatiales bacterium]|nr:nitrite reductase [Chromatiales bacterium]